MRIPIVEVPKLNAPQIAIAGALVVVIALALSSWLNGCEVARLEKKIAQNEAAADSNRQQILRYSGRVDELKRKDSILEQRIEARNIEISDLRTRMAATLNRKPPKAFTTTTDAKEYLLRELAK